jgi:hypothetical protein
MFHLHHQIRKQLGQVCQRRDLKSHLQQSNTFMRLHEQLDSLPYTAPHQFDSDTSAVV